HGCMPVPAGQHSREMRRAPERTAQADVCVVPRARMCRGRFVVRQARAAAERHRPDPETLHPNVCGWNTGSWCGRSSHRQATVLPFRSSFTIVTPRPLIPPVRRSSFSRQRSPWMTQPDSRDPNRPLPRALVALVLFMTATELVLQAGDLGIVGDGMLRFRVYAAGAFWASLFHGAEPLFALQPITMFVSHALLHGGLLHLAMNAAILLGLGRMIGERYGDGTVLPLFLLSAIAGGIVFALINDSDIPMVGASGAV